MSAARVALGRSMDWLAERTKLPVSELLRLEAGQREFRPSELSRIAEALALGVDWFMTESPQAVRSLRADRVEGPRVARFDLLLEGLARDVELLRSLGLLQLGLVDDRASIPDNVDGAEGVARGVRHTLELGVGPLLDLDRVAERLGVYTLCLRLEPTEPDGAYVALDSGGVVVVNGVQPAGRRRFTLAHEIGHHMFQDQYSTDWLGAGSQDTEKIVNAFAVHLLLPRESLVAQWNKLARTHEPRVALLLIAVEYRVSWSVACAQCARFRLITEAQHEALAAWSPSRADYMELGLRIEEELVPPSLSPMFTRAVVSAYRTNRISGARAIEMLRGTLELSELPGSDDVPLQAYSSELESP